MRGSGDHHRIGSPSEYHGKMPWVYASTRRSGESSPPAHSSPLGDASAFVTGGNGSPLRSQGITSPAQGPRGPEFQARDRLRDSRPVEYVAERAALAVGERERHRADVGERGARPRDRVERRAARAIERSGERAGLLPAQLAAHEPEV